MAIVTNEWLMVTEACAYLKIGRATLYRWAKEGRLRLYKLSRRTTRVRFEDLSRLARPIDLDWLALSQDALLFRRTPLRKTGITKGTRSTITGEKSTAYQKSDVVLVPFPFTNLTASRVRPAVIVSNPTFEEETGDIIAAMITTQPHFGQTDFEMLDWRDAGLLPPSWVRIKLATLDIRIIQLSLGRLSSRDASGVEQCLDLALQRSTV